MESSIGNNPTASNEMRTGLGLQVRIYGLIAASMIGVVLAACGPTISLPVTVKTSKGELLRGMAQGPALSGNVVLSSDTGTRCEGPYTTSQDRIISAVAQCSDGRKATLQARLEADLVSAWGTADLSDGTTAQVGVGKHAERLEASEARDSTAKSLVGAWHDANGVCRGTPGGSESACEKREALGARLEAIGYCYGERGQYGYQMKWHRCHSRST